MVIIMTIIIIIIIIGITSIPNVISIITIVSIIINNIVSISSIIINYYYYKPHEPFACYTSTHTSADLPLGHFVEEFVVLLEGVLEVSVPRDTERMCRVDGRVEPGEAVSQPRVARH